VATKTLNGGAGDFLFLRSLNDGFNDFHLNGTVVFFDDFDDLDCLEEADFEVGDNFLGFEDDDNGLRIFEDDVDGLRGFKDDNNGLRVFKDDNDGLRSFRDDDNNGFRSFKDDDCL
jgi:hypothetical protein